jgi:hypothetical protein
MAATPRVSGASGPAGCPPVRRRLGGGSDYGAERSRDEWFHGGHMYNGMYSVRGRGRVLEDSKVESMFGTLDVVEVGPAVDGAHVTSAASK